MKERKEILISKENENVRIDKFLANNFSDLSRSYIQNLINQGNIIVNDQQR